MELATGEIVWIMGCASKIEIDECTHFVPIPYLIPFKAMILGKSMRHVGKLEGDMYSEIRHVAHVNESRAVWMVMRLDGNRYRKPIAVFPEQVQL